MIPTIVMLLKAPRAGLAKTRLAREVGAERAVAIYRRLAADQLRRIPDAWPVEIHFTPAEAEPDMRAWLGSRAAYFPQAEGDLGARLQAAFVGAFGRAAGPVLAMGGDCPGLDEPTLQQAACEMEKADVVLGPAVDGGYYLVGLMRVCPGIFRGIPWSTGEVFRVTRERAVEEGLRTAVLEVKADIDEGKDWTDYVATRSGRLSVVIPALNESLRISDTVGFTRNVLPDAEVLVIDGGSGDDTAQRAASAGAQVLRAARGRGLQLRAGADVATGDWLLFLHADSTLPAHAAELIQKFIERPGARAATFRLRFDGGGWFLAACAWFTRLDSVLTRFGDQGILIRADFYHELGGFPAWPLFEDVALLQRARRRTRIHSLAGEIVTSARRFERRGVVAQQLLNARLLGQYLLGMPPEKLAEIYRASRTETGGMVLKQHSRPGTSQRFEAGRDAVKPGLHDAPSRTTEP